MQVPRTGQIARFGQAEQSSFSTSALNTALRWAAKGEPAAYYQVYGSAGQADQWRAVSGEDLEKAKTDGQPKRLYIVQVLDVQA